ncbi:MAG: K+-sensing histidine kinase KdpD [Sphingobacteriales bacterium]|jgi:K+-sensing histidine kinase KdpD
MNKDQSEDSRSQFFTNISHKFKTPLTLIIGPLEDLISEINDKSQTKHLNQFAPIATGYYTHSGLKRGHKTYWL